MGNRPAYSTTAFLRRRLGSAPPEHPSVIRQQPHLAHGACGAHGTAAPPERSGTRQSAVPRGYPGAGHTLQNGIG